MTAVEVFWFAPGVAALLGAAVAWVRHQHRAEAMPELTGEHAALPAGYVGSAAEPAEGVPPAQPEPQPQPRSHAARSRPQVRVWDWPNGRLPRLRVPAMRLRRAAR